MAKIKLSDKSINTIPWIILFSGIIISILLCLNERNAAEKKAINEFNQICNQVSLKIEERFKSNASMLLGVKGHFTSVDYPYRSKFKFFVDSLQLETYSPSIEGLAYAPVITKDQLKKFESKIEQEGFKNFKVQPEGIREIYTPVQYVEPMSKQANQLALGFDTFSNPQRKEAQELARDSGNVTITRKVNLIKDANSTTLGVLIIAPVYEKNRAIDTVEQRRSNLKGYVISPIRINTLMEDILRDIPLVNNDNFSLKIYDRSQNTPENLLYQNASSRDIQSISLFNQSQTLQIDKNINWDLDFDLIKPFEVVGYHQSWIILISGLSISGLLFLLTSSQLKYLNKAKSISKELTEKNTMLNFRTSMAIKSAKMGVWEYNVFTRENIWDERQFELYDYSKDNHPPVEEVLMKRVHLDDHERCFECLNSAIKGYKDFEIDFRVVLSNGKIRYLRALGIPIKNSQNRTSRLVGVTYDVTDEVNQKFTLLASKKSADEANRSKTKFLTTMSHEIRTPMSGIIGISNIAQNLEMSKEVRSYFEKINSLAKSLLKILNEILDLSKIESGQLKLDLEPVNLRNLYYEVYELFLPSATLKNISLLIEFDERIPEVLIIDDLRLKQILFNLIGNAIKFTSQGHVLIKTTLQDIRGDLIDINTNIEDSGIGIKANEISGITEPFTQADDRIGRRFGGTGLGLSITQELLNLMGSKLIINSKINKGTNISFHLNAKIGSLIQPIAALKQPEDLNQATPYSGIQGKKVLLAEDNEIIREVIFKMLKFLGVEVQVAMDGQECIELSHKDAYDLILMDIQMPNLDGLDTTRLIRKIPGYQNVPVIAISAGITMGEKELSKKSGMNDFLSKPIELDQLSEILQKWLLKDLGSSTN